MALETEKFAQWLTRRFIGQIDKWMYFLFQCGYPNQICKSDSRYPESMPIATHFIRFAKVGKVKDEMAEWGKIK